MKTIKSLILCVVFSLSTAPSDAQELINIYGNLEFGSQNVGFKQTTFDDEHNKFRISVWYPAEVNYSRLKFSDYFNYKQKLDNSEIIKALSSRISGDIDRFSADSLNSILNAKMKSYKEAKTKNGNFPLLIWSTRYGTLEYQNVFSEFIASHGYVVAFIEDVPNSLFPWEIQSIDEKISAINDQLNSINIAITYMKKQTNVDNANIGLLSWSYAGESAILSQMKNPEIKLVVSLSSVDFSRGVYYGKDLANRIDVKKIKVPYLILSETTAPNGMVKNTPYIFDSMHPNSRYIFFDSLTHGNFNTIEGMIPGILRTNKVQNWSKGGETAQIGYEAICKSVLSFLNAVFKKKSFESFDVDLNLLQRNLPQEFISVKSPKRE